MSLLQSNTKTEMTLLPDHEYFESLIGRGNYEQYEKTEFPERVIVYFTAKWCGACKRVALDALVENTPDIKWLKCDVDMVPETLGYCNMQSIPSFAYVENRKFKGNLSSSDNAKIAYWIKSMLQ